MKINTKNLDSFEFEGIDTSDYPDFCDAFLTAGSIKDKDTWRALTEDEIEWINENEREWIYEKLMEWIF